MPAWSFHVTTDSLYLFPVLLLSSLVSLINKKLIDYDYLNWKSVWSLLENERHYRHIDIKTGVIV